MIYENVKRVFDKISKMPADSKYWRLFKHWEDLGKPEDFHSIGFSVTSRELDLNTAEVILLCTVPNGLKRRHTFTGNILVKEWFYFSDLANLMIEVAVAKSQGELV